MFILHLLFLKKANRNKRKSKKEKKITEHIIT